MSNKLTGRHSRSSPQLFGAAIGGDGDGGVNVGNVRSICNSDGGWNGSSARDIGVSKDRNGGGGKSGSGLTPSALNDYDSCDSFPEDEEEEEEEELSNLKSFRRVNSDGGGIGWDPPPMPPEEITTPRQTVPGQFDLCGSMYKRRGGFGRNAENNW